MHEFHGHVIQMEVRGRLRRNLGIKLGFQGNIMHWEILLTLVVVMLVFLSRELLILKDFQIVFNLLYILWAAQWYELNTSFLFINITYNIYFSSCMMIPFEDEFVVFLVFDENMFIC